MSTFYTLGLRIEKSKAIELFSKYEEVSISKQPGSTKIHIEICLSSYTETFDLLNSFKDTVISIRRNETLLGDFVNGIETGSGLSFNECLK